MVSINKLDYISIAKKAIAILRSCKNEKQLAVARRYSELFVKHMKNMGVPRNIRHPIDLRLDRIYVDVKKELS